ncbi:TetR/AcrR family transcriptional regulator [Nevskia soli]|uniref:TetR/AcrR family transcriptional regulator n=1 Tax=Nevskia soli TaxID=418856 RepID=UPI00068FC2DD|nr:TetR/AcrR family transcriptional regulator [Nevskia soli]
MSTDTAQRILDRAQDLMIERGYNAFSYADIAEVVKVSKATIHFHYASKAVLSEQVVRRYREGVMSNLRQLSRQVADAPARLEAYAGYWENCIRTNTAPLCMCALLAAEMLTLPDPVKSEVQAFFRDLEAWLAGTLDDGVRQGALRLPRDSALEAKSLLAVVYGAMLTAHVSRDAAAFAAVVGDAIGRLKAAAPTPSVKKARKRPR